MTQTILLTNLAKYLRLTNPDTTAEVRVALERHGHCFGLSLCHGAIHKTGKLDIWLDELVYIATWNGLLEPRKLRNEANQKVIEEPDKSFNKALSFIIFHHASEDKEYKDVQLTGMEQISILDPDHQIVIEFNHVGHISRYIKIQSIFEIIDKNGDCRYIEKREFFVKDFTTRKLAAFLKQNTTMIEESICLIHALRHTLSLCYENKIWILYHPNYDHTKKETIHKKFFSSHFVAGEILDIVGTTIGIEFASFDQHLKIEYPEEKTTVKALQNSGLSLMAKFKPLELPALLALADQTEEGRITIAIELARIDLEEWTGLCWIIIRAPNCVDKALSIALKTSIGIHEALTKTRLKFSKQMTPGLSLLFRQKESDAEKFIFEAALAEWDEAKLSAMLQTGVNPNRMKIGTLLNHKFNQLEQGIAIQKRIIMLLLHHGLDQDVVIDELRNTLLHFVLLLNDIDLVQCVIQPSNILIRNNANQTSFQLASYYHGAGFDPRIIQLFLPHEMQEAVADFDLKRVNDLFAQGADSKQVHVSKTFKRWAKKINSIQSDVDKNLTQKKMEAIFDLLIVFGIDINAPDQEEFTALHWGAHYNCVSLVRLALNKGANHLKKNREGRTPFQEAKALNGETLDPNIIALFKEKNTESLPEAIRRLCVEEVIYLLESGITNENVALPDVFRFIYKDNWHLMNEPARAIYTIKEIISHLINYSFSINEGDQFGNTILHWAAYINNSNIVEYLLRLGANPLVQNVNDITPLQKGKMTNDLRLDAQIKTMFLERSFCAVSDDKQCPPNFKKHLAKDALTTLKNLLRHEYLPSPGLGFFSRKMKRRSHEVEVINVLAGFNDYINVQSIYDVLTSAKKRLKPNGVLVGILSFCATLNGEKLILTEAKTNSCFSLRA
ncbi:MAG: ankyrin repeat domain-containing protein [Gammaproteobacteria bacterium]